METKNAKKFNILSNSSQKIGQFFGLIVVLIVFFVFTGNARAAALPAPTLLVPDVNTRLGQDRVWVGGVAFNGSEITVLVDGEAKINSPVRNHKSGVGSFGVELVNLGLGSHKITAISHDSHDRTSAVSNELLINIEPKTPAPTLYKPVVNGDAGIERPFIVGNIQAGLEVKVVINDKIVANVSPKDSNSNITSFAWQPAVALALGQHKIEVFASDKGKLSNNSEPIYWQVGKATNKSEEKVSQNMPAGGAGGDDSILSVTDSSQNSENLTVTDKKIEKPVIPEKPLEPETPVAVAPPVQPEPKVTAEAEAVVDGIGQIDTGETVNKEIAINDQGDKVREITPGAVVKQVPSDEDSGFELNNSLIVGIAILIFLLLSMAVWYVQERKDKLGEKVVGMFKETENDKNHDLPPPPPPVF